MSYELRTVDGKYQRVLTNEEFKAILNLALHNGWRPTPKHLHNNRLWLNEPFHLEEGKAFAAAIERGLQQPQANLSPMLVMAVLECIAILRRSDSCFVPV
jgi:hypothetical protein